MLFFKLYSLFWAAAWFIKLDWRCIFVAVSSCNAILWSLKVLIYFNGRRFSSLQSVEISSAHVGRLACIFKRVEANIRSGHIMAENLHIKFFLNTSSCINEWSVGLLSAHPTVTFLHTALQSVVFWTYVLMVSRKMCLKYFLICNYFM